ncbi:MAG TPA: Gfo/Idh/MocA family oxidoreductase [Thermomicrobiales bacterium]|jgi:predicted dehydrogenase
MTNIAVFGAGTMGTMHAASCHALPNANLAWVVDEDRDRAATLAAPTGARVTADLAEALADPMLDAVILAVPTPFHRALTEQAAEAGKHVFCEKPIALSLDDARAMTAACERAGVRFMVGHVVRFFPEYTRIKDLLDREAIGQVGVVRASRVNAYPFVGRGWYSNFAWSGGPILDMMIHDLDTLRWFFGEVARISARGLSYSPQRSAVDYALAIIRFASGVVAHVETSWAHSNFRTSIELAGSAGIIRHASDETAALKLERTVHTEATAGVNVPRSPLAESPYQTELRHFLDRIADGAPILTGGDEATRSLAAALAVLESVRTGKTITFTDGWPMLEEQGLVSDSLVAS